MGEYDPFEAPDPSTWLSLSEDERTEVILVYHENAEESAPNLTAHAAFHAIVENQLAMGESAVVETLNRLLGEGLDRHDAVHAIGSVLAEHMYDVAQGEGDAPNKAYGQRLRQLTASKWLRGAS